MIVEKATAYDEFFDARKNSYHKYALIVQISSKHSK